MKPFTLFRPAATALVLSIAIGCAQLGLQTGGSSSSVERITETGVLRVGMSGSQPPLNMTTRAGELIGMEVDLARSLADAIGVEAELVTMPFGELLPALEDGKVDVVISGLTMTPERNLRVAFAGPYLISGKAVLTKSAALAAADEPSDVNQPVRMAALAGSTSESFVERHLPEVELIATSDYDEAIRKVIDDEVDALLADYPACVLALFQHPDAGLATVISPFTFEPIGIALPADAPLLTNLVSNYLVLLEGAGVLGQLRAQWFENGSWVSEL